MRPWMRFAIKLLLLAGVVAALTLRFPDRVDAVLDGMRLVSGGQIAAIAAIGLLSQVLYAVRWRALLDEPGADVPPLSTFVRYTLVSQMIGLAAPGGAQILVQGLMTRSEGSGGAEPWLALGAERLISLATNPVVAGVALLLLPSSMRWLGLGVLAAGALAIGLLLVAHRGVAWASRTLPERIVDLAGAVGPRIRRPGVVVPAALGHVALGVLFVIIFVPGSEMLAGDVMGVALLTAWAGLLPSLFGLGPAQAAQVVLLVRIGGDPSIVAAQALVIWGFSVVAAVAAGAVAWLVGPRPSAEEPS